VVGLVILLQSWRRGDRPDDSGSGMGVS